MPINLKIFAPSKISNPGIVELGWFGFADNSGDMSRNELLEKLVGLKDEIEILDLSANKFGLCDLTFLLSMFQSIQTKIGTLNLSLNQFYLFGYEKMLQLMTHIPVVDNLEFSNNRLYNFSIEQFVGILKALPASVQVIDMTNTMKNNPDFIQGIEDNLKRLGRKLIVNFNTNNLVFSDKLDFLK